MAQSLNQYLEGRVDTMGEPVLQVNYVNSPKKYQEKSIQKSSLRVTGID